MKLVLKDRQAFRKSLNLYIILYSFSYMIIQGGKLHSVGHIDPFKKESYFPSIKATFVRPSMGERNRAFNLYATNII